jgi:anaerobic ribonucleoside-triphosphate reductase
MFKCHNCKLILKDTDLIDGVCPECKQVVVVMCSKDTGSCNHGVVDGIRVCEECGEFMCPECGAHDVEVLSRITGYYSPVNSWNSAKRAELTDRVKYNGV